ncbi:high mobility group protein 20A isoform X2 [Ctenocephalides felis]|nr:high mobility group protein 20A isoform X2 [Ctenocephalides felis]
MDNKNTRVTDYNTDGLLAGSSDDKAPDSSENGIRKPKVVKGKKRKLKSAKDAGAPKQPLTGYIRFMNERRESLKAEKPTLGFVELTRLLAEEWGSLEAAKKKQYLDAAEQDRERYLREVDEYKQNAAKTVPAETPQQNSKQANNNPPAQKSLKQEDVPTELDIPIFTEEFLEHNKIRETELRQLRKSNTDYEQQNAILQKHIENMRMAIDKLEAETEGHKSSNVILGNHLEKLRTGLVDGFKDFAITGFDGATLQNIDEYMIQLQTVLQTSGQNALKTKARDILNQLDVPT